MRWTQIAEGVEIDCSRCGDLIGKAKELPKGTVTCGNCGQAESNPYGYEHSKGQDEKFGRLALTGVYTEEGTTQGTLKTSKGVTLGSLCQYGPKWHDYDNGNWEAFCSAIKKRKKGFPDKKKAVEWIVRQTRVAQKSAVAEAIGDPMIFGRTVPNWNHEDEKGDAAHFTDASGHHTAEVLFRANQWEVVMQGKDQFFKSNQDVEKCLSENGYTEFVGWDYFSPDKNSAYEI